MNTFMVSPKRQGCDKKAGDEGGRWESRVWRGGVEWAVKSIRLRASIFETGVVERGLGTSRQAGDKRDIIEKSKVARSGRSGMRAGGESVTRVASSGAVVEMLFGQSARGDGGGE